MGRANKHQARQIAVRALTAGLELDVRDGDNWPAGRLVPTIYGLSEEFPAGHWVVLVGDPKPHIGSSEVVVVRKRDGEVLYHGEVGE